MNAIALPEQAVTPFANAGSFETAQRIATALSASSLVPAPYRGRENLPNVLIALEIANRIGASPLSVMQNLHIIQGKPSWSASFLIATVNACGRFSPLRFEIDGDDAFAKAYRVRCHGKDRESGEVCEGPWITWKMVEAEGWNKKPGSKWLSMPALMFLYRAAAFWARVYAPELSLGIHTAEEVHDVATARLVPEREDVAQLQNLLTQRATNDAPADPDVIQAVAGAVSAAMAAATTQDELDAAAEQISLCDQGSRPELLAEYETHVDRLALP